MGLNIICYLQHPNQTYIPMSMILWYYVLQKNGMKQLMSRLFILQIRNLSILMLLTKYTLESQSNSTQPKLRDWKFSMATWLKCTISL
jgi:hypothetical protein